ncbi:MAG: hypothetical protein HY332_20665 [Chloroflexi bacterium]|nr:hypothetical protein [Chloroflexota bacterium]
MALQRLPGTAPAATPAASILSTPSTTGPALSTRETIARPFVELGIMFGQALGGREPVMQALTNLQAVGQEHGCDAIISVKLMHYPTTAGPAVVAYGTGVRFLPSANQTPAATGTTEAAAPAEGAEGTGPPEQPGEPGAAPAGGNGGNAGQSGGTP